LSIETEFYLFDPDADLEQILPLDFNIPGFNSQGKINTSKFMPLPAPTLIMCPV
jgi:hypothetical protein